MKRTSIVLLLALVALCAPGLMRALAQGVSFTSPPPGAALRRTVTVAAQADPGTISVTFSWSSDGGCRGSMGRGAGGPRLAWVSLSWLGRFRRS